MPFPFCAQLPGRWREQGTALEQMPIERKDHLPHNGSAFLENGNF
jgi:hypothetical protein